MDLNLNFFRHISIAFVFFIQSHVSAQVAGHFMKEKQYNVCISTAKGNMILRSQGNGELEACQPYLAWRPSGQEKWNQSYGEKFIVKQQNQNIVEFQTSLAGIEATITAQRIGNNIWEFSGILVNKKPIAIDLARFHYLHGSISGESVGLLAMDGTMAVHNDTLPSSRSAVENLWKSFGVFWPRLPDPIHDSANWAVSLDCGILTTSYTQPGWFAGFTDPGTAFGEIGFKTQTQPSQFFAGILLDNIKVEPGESRTLEKMIIVYGDWQQSLQLWANRCAIELHAPSIKPPVVGYCSWYQHGPNIKPLHMERAIKGVAELPIPPGGRIVQIDDGFEVMPGDWGPSKKFKEAWPALPGKIKSTGSIPGYYLAPTAIHETHPIAKEHPEWLQHLPDGKLAVSFSNWADYNNNDSNNNDVNITKPDKKTYFLEIDRPEATQYIAPLFTEAKAQGRQYIKINFTYALSTARVQYNKKKTSFESLRDLFALFREASGKDILLNACIGEPGRYALGNVDIARLGGDIGSNWATIRSNLMQLFMGVPTNGIWWQADPDVFYMRREITSLTAEENYLLTGTVGLIGGVFITSDYPSQWSDSAKEAVAEFWNNDGPRVPFRNYILYSDKGIPEAFCVSYNDGKAPQHRIGFYNWTSDRLSKQIPLSAFSINPAVNWKSSAASKSYPADINMDKQKFIIKNQPANSLRIINLTEK